MAAIPHTTITRTTFCSFPSPPSNHSRGKKRCLLYFIPGNPGFIDYYKPFLETLRTLLNGNANQSPLSIDLYGANLIGFAEDDNYGSTMISLPLDLEAQIQEVAKHLAFKASHDLNYDMVILAGHSVGAYIAMEIFHRRYTLQDPILKSIPLHSAFLLFPTLTHLARSRAGKRLALLQYHPRLEELAVILACLILCVFPDWLIRLVIRQPPHAASTTLQFLRSRHSIRQALHMGLSEIDIIKEDKWAEDLWELESRAGSGSRFFLYYAKSDHWVDDVCRHELVERRTRQSNGVESKPSAVTVEICEKGIPHAFCLNYSEVMAEKVQMWLNEIAQRVEN